MFVKFVMCPCHCVFANYKEKKEEKKKDISSFGNTECKYAFPKFILITLYASFLCKLAVPIIYMLMNTIMFGFIKNPLDIINPFSAPFEG